MNKFPETHCIQCTKNYPFRYPKFPLYQEEHNQKFFPCQGEHPDIFIMEIPQASANFDRTGYVFINNCFIKETQIKHLNFFNGQSHIDQKDPSTIIKIPGRLAIVSHLYPYCYGHWMFDILGQLALLEINNIEYDYLCIPYYKKFMKESLELWNIDRNKIIPLTNEIILQADTIIMLTAISQDKMLNVKANYYVDFVLRYVHDKLLTSIKTKKMAYHFSEKIFISRNDAGGKRAIPNEDKIFELLKPFGFTRYYLTQLSMLEQIALFNNAKTIVSFLGSGSTNVIFCKPNTHYIEIIQKMIDPTFFFISQTFNLKYSFINESTNFDLLNGSPWSRPAALSLRLVQNFLNQHPKL